MARRNRFKDDELAFPIRVKVVVPIGGLGLLAMRMQAWLDQTLGPAGWAWGPAHSNSHAQATGYYFREVEDLRQWLEAFPELVLADGVDRLHYAIVARPPSAAPTC